jgi:hypothetical protein
MEKGDEREERRDRQLDVFREEKGDGCVSISSDVLSYRITFICHGEAAGKSGTSGKNTLVVRGAIGLSEINS